MLKKGVLFLFICFSIQVFLYSQTHIAVPLGHPVYIALEQAQMRGLFRPLPNVKPYTRAQVLSIIDEILDNDNKRRFGRLSETERRILLQFKDDLSPPREGLDLIRGTYFTEHDWNGTYFSGQLGFGMDMIFSGSYFSLGGGLKDTTPFPEDFDDLTGFEGAAHPASGDGFMGFEVIPSVSFIGDLGRKVSYGLTLGIWVGRTPRTIQGTYFSSRLDREARRTLVTYSEPLTFFPFTYMKRWDGYVFPSDDLSTSGMVAWPDGDLFLGYYMMPELAGTLLNGHIFYRFARLEREWAGMSNSSSLVLNQTAQPFLAFETVIQPFPWISFSSLTGVLEYHNAVGGKSAEIEEVARTFQNAYSIVMLEFNINEYFYTGFGSSVVWPKRFELGYIFPFADNFIYQTNIGDFDNMALFFNLQAQYPGIGKLWLSVFIDEMSPASGFFQLARMMYAYQFGGAFQIPWLPFSSIKVSYSKNEPYNYTHMRIRAPWYGDDLLMETNTVSFGKALGYYIPPNSDEFLVRFEILPFPQSMASLQYQLIRHGSTYGDRAVEGSSLWSELLGQRTNTKKFFLQDGAYQWMHIVRFRWEQSLTGFNFPVRTFAEIGGVYSYFTDIFDNDGNMIEPNSNKKGKFKIINTPHYPHSLSFIGVFGVRIFPKF
ncbi:MAG: hypothetical protein LBC80_04030 [Treponema sp.]|jgi:hypothetical protein|nr:hypothetical protein [Treponema sp.]